MICFENSHRIIHLDWLVQIRTESKVVQNQIRTESKVVQNQIRTESKFVQNTNWESAHFNKTDNREYFMSSSEGVQTIQNWNINWLKTQLTRFIATWKKINWIGFLRCSKFWLIIFFWNYIWRRERSDDSVRICTIKYTLLPNLTYW